jgi:putative acetyltransferase
MNLNEIEIRIANQKDFTKIMEVEKLAFGSDDEAKLVSDLLEDHSAKPTLSLLALYKNEAIGHILFTKASVEKYEKSVIHLLAPLAVKSEFQKRGVGGLLIQKGLELLKKIGTELVFVLGHKTYYPKYGFIPDAKSLGFQAPYPIPEKDADAWMVQSLTEDGLVKIKGAIKVADKLMKPDYWKE